MILWQKKKGGEVSLQQQNIALSQTGEINANKDSISDLVRKVKGNVKMYKYSKSVGSGANYN